MQPLFGPEIIVRSLSVPSLSDSLGNSWQYHSRSDRHSKVACVAILFDLMRTCEILERHIRDQKIFMGINHRMTDFGNNRHKNLDLVICTQSGDDLSGNYPNSFGGLFGKYGIQLKDRERDELAKLPPLRRASVGSVRLALEAKAAMTAHQRALPRLYDELNSSHLTVHGNTSGAIAAGFVMINAAETFVSPDLNKFDLTQQRPVVSRHKQPRDATLVMDRIKQLQRRTSSEGVGFDALGTIFVDCKNNGEPITLSSAKVLPDDEMYSYRTMIDRIGHWYGLRFGNL